MSFLWALKLSLSFLEKDVFDHLWNNIYYFLVVSLIFGM